MTFLNIQNKPTGLNIVEILNVTFAGLDTENDNVYDRLRVNKRVKLVLLRWSFNALRLYLDRRLS